MNGNIRPGGGPQTVPGLHLSSRLPSLVQRLRGPELDRLATLIDPDSPSQIAEAGRSHQSEAKRLQREHDSLQKESNNMATPQALQQLVLERLQSGEFDELSRHPSSLKRWLNVQALLDLYKRQIDQHGISMELCARLLGGLQLTPPATRFLQSLLHDPRLPTRREAARTLAEWCISQQAAGEMDTLLAEELLEAAVTEGQDPLTARGCLLVLSVLGSSGDAALAELLPESDKPRFPAVVRCQAVRMALLGGTSRQDWAWSRSRLDPSEQVRSALVEALAAEGSLVSIDRLASLSKRDPSSSVRKRAQLLLEERELPGSFQQAFETSAEMSALVADCSDLDCGESLSTGLPGSESPMDLAVALLESASDSFGFAIAPTQSGHLRVTRGDRKILRFWRLFHELRNPAPGKRLLGDHLSGRSHGGPIRVEGEGLGERFPTGVPNQPHHINENLGTAPWLPLPEAALEAADWGSILIVTAQGVTSLHAPQSNLARIWAQLRISTRMASLMKKRSRALHSDVPSERRQYIRELEDLGYRTEFKPHPEQVAPMAGIDQYFGVAAPPALLASNSPTDLAVVASVVGAYTVYQLHTRRRQVEQTRAALPLCIGNWGTRGKSSVTRLQAALFEGLGYTVLAKTTGSEASLFLAGQGKSGRRLATYRPMNKVSILEHQEALQRAKALGAQVFVWECMALRPEYVDQVQHQWTQDDLATITNAHADHEDVQGPTGRDVAEVIAGFIPENSLAISTEHAMRAVLEEAASERNTSLKTVSNLAIQAVPADLLESFPHREHPSNLALALQVAAELGCDREEAGYLMAAHSVADLGALRVTPPMRVTGRRLSLSNGMSANQPAGLLSNWSSCGFFEADPLGHPNRYFLSIVNNRQDRPQRSRAFARCMVRSLPAHRHILIGSNLPGFRRQIEEELREHLDEWTLPDSPKATEQRLRALRKQLCLSSPGPLLRSTALLLGLRSSQMANIAEEMDNRIAQVGEDISTFDQALAQLEPLRESLNQLAHQIEGALFHNSRERRAVIRDAQEHWLTCAAEALLFASVAKACALTHSPERRLQLLKKTYTELFMRHILTLPGQPSADRVMQFAAQCSPPGTEIHAMAIQNIHGPGRSLAQAIQSSSTLMELSMSLLASPKEEQVRVLRHLRTPQMWTVPLCQEILRTIYAMPAQPELAGERDLTVNHVHQRLESCERALQIRPNRTGFLQRAAVFSQNSRLPFQVIRNRRRADRILDALCFGLISRQRAATELDKIIEEDAGHFETLDPNSPMVS